LASTRVPWFWTGQKSGYEYERSFAEMMREIEEEVFKELTSTETIINK
jgi:hypothetical protein